MEIAAWFHDVGYTVGGDDHERRGADAAIAWLSKEGAAPQVTGVVSELIRTTAMPQAPRTPLQALLCDADLASLGSADFARRSEALRQERGCLEATVPSPEAWLRDQLQFLRQHRWWTAAARTAWDTQKARNLALLEDTAP